MDFQAKTEEKATKMELGATLLRRFYREMLRIREFEEEVSNLLEGKEVQGPVHLCIGQEAVAVGVCAALERDDYIFGAHRSHGHYLAKGGDMRALMAELFGKETGCSGGRGGSMHLVAPEVGLLGTVPIVAATIPLAAGVALASQLRGDSRVTVSFFGDGATEEGVFHETMNFAASRKLPVIFACENNYYASHLFLLERRTKDNIAVAAEAYGMPGSRIDGNDVVGTYLAARAAVARARRGEGPTLIEFITFRWRGHVGPSWDTDVGVTRKVDLAAWMKKDPIARLRSEILARDSSMDIASTDVEVRAEVQEAIRHARESRCPPTEKLTDYLFKNDGAEVLPNAGN